jgi:hypothetical protein
VNKALLLIIGLMSLSGCALPVVQVSEQIRDQLPKISSPLENGEWFVLAVGPEDTIHPEWYTERANYTTGLGGVFEIEEYPEIGNIFINNETVTLVNVYNGPKKEYSNPEIKLFDFSGSIRDIRHGLYQYESKPAPITCHYKLDSRYICSIALFPNEKGTGIFKSSMFPVFSLVRNTQNSWWVEFPNVVGVAMLGAEGKAKYEVIKGVEHDTFNYIGPDREKVYIESVILKDIDYIAEAESLFQPRYYANFYAIDEDGGWIYYLQNGKKKTAQKYTWGNSNLRLLIVNRQFDPSELTFNSSFDGGKEVEVTPDSLLTAQRDFLPLVRESIIFNTKGNMEEEIVNYNLFAETLRKYHFNNVLLSYYVNTMADALFLKSIVLSKLAEINGESVPYLDYLSTGKQGYDTYQYFSGKPVKLNALEMVQALWFLYQELVGMLKRDDLEKTLHLIDLDEEYILKNVQGMANAYMAASNLVKCKHKKELSAFEKMVGKKPEVVDCLMHPIWHTERNIQFLPKK